MTQCGAVAVIEVEFVLPPVVPRRKNEIFFAGIATTDTCFDVAVSDSRIMMPAFAYRFVFCTEATRAMICPSPVRA